MSTKLGDLHAGIEFLKSLFGPSTEHSVYVCSLLNDKGGEGQSERHIADRDEGTLTTFCNHWDRYTRGLFFCVATIKAGSRRNRANALELPALHTDIDFKSIREDPATVIGILRNMRLPPTVIISSGHGLHCYWFFKEALDVQANIDRIEAALKLLADTVGGDMQVTHVAALMRLPGSHNTKGDQWLDVGIVQQTDARYELEDIEEWLAEQSPVITRKDRPVPPETNPYLAIAAQLQFKAPVDVEQRLAAMRYQGEGDASIHATQVSVSAALLTRGEDPERVVEMLLRATQHAAGGYGERWNWRREESNIRRMCVTWAAKLQRSPGRAQRERPASGGPIPGQAVVNLAQARAKRDQAQEEAPAKGGKKFHAVAQAAVLALRQRGEDLLFEDGACWHYTDALWTMRTDHRAWLSIEIEKAARGLGITSDSKLTNEARAWLERNPDLNAGQVRWDQHGLVPIRSGLFDPVSGELVPALPSHYVTWRAETTFDPAATCPLWLTMLEQAFADRQPAERAAVITTLQELLGAGLIDRKPRGLRKALVLYGGPSSGKSQLLAVLGGLFGDACIRAPLSVVDTPHGLMPFRRRLPWVLDEAFNQNVWHLSSSVKMLVMGEHIAINVKNGPMLEGQYLGPVFWATNHPPAFKESTRAIVERIVTIECRQNFATSARSPSDAVLEDELPGVLVWALGGLQRALKRGAIEISAESRAGAERIYRDSNLVAGFVEECVAFDGNGRVSLPDFCIAVSAWYAENKGEDRRLPSNEQIGRALVALHDPRIASDKRELRDNAARYVVGIQLNSHGLEYHARGIQADMFEGKTVQTTSSGGAVNGMIPITWDAKPSVVRMREAHITDSENVLSRTEPLSDS